MTANNARIPVTNCDKLRARIITLHDTHGLKFRQMARMGEFYPVPAGTLCTIYNTGKVPKKWHKKFGIQEMKPAPVCQICGEVHVSRTCPTQRKQPTRWADMPTSAVLTALQNRTDF